MIYIMFIPYVLVYCSVSRTLLHHYIYIKHLYYIHVRSVLLAMCILQVLGVKAHIFFKYRATLDPRWIQIQFSQRTLQTNEARISLCEGKERRRGRLQSRARTSTRVMQSGEDIYTCRVTGHLGLPRAKWSRSEGAACNLAIALPPSKGGEQRRGGQRSHGKRKSKAAERKSSRGSNAAGERERSRGGKRQRSESGSRSGALGLITLFKLDRGMTDSTSVSPWANLLFPVFSLLPLLS